MTMNVLDDFEQELFASAYQGERWMYLPRVHGDQFGLAIAVVGRPGKIDIPFDLCHAPSFDAIKGHAEQLNNQKLQQAA